MAKTVRIVSNKGFGWSIDGVGAQTVTLSTRHNYAWTAEKHGVPLDAVVTNDGEAVTHLGEIVTNGA